ncbi:DDE-1 domain-containing protein [Trichonephila clavipes]|nr:DDE-1 domain-containing protein [Trichonephila clavipes]
MNKIRKTAAVLNCPIVLSEEFVAVDDNVCTALNMADKYIGFVQSSKIIIDKDSNDEDEMDNATPVPTSSEMRNIMKSIHSYLEAYFNGERNNKMIDIEQFVDNFNATKTMERKISDYFQKSM